MATNEPAREGTSTDPERMRELLQRHLQPAPGRTLQVTDCRIANVRLRDGLRGAVHYEIRVEDRDTGQVSDQVVTGLVYGGARTRQVWDVIRSEMPAGSGSVQSLLQPFAYAPEMDMLLQVFPHDHRLPALARLMAGPPPEIVPALLQELGSGDWQIWSWNAEVVQYRADMRAILRLTVTATDADTGRREERQYYAKVYRDGIQAQQAHRAQRDLHESARTAARLAIAKPILYAEGLRTIVTQAVPGTSLSKVIRRGDNVEPVMRAAARAVSEFHRLDVAAPQRPVADDVAQLKEAEQFLVTARPELAAELSEIVAAVTAGLVDAPSSLIHGDLKPDHMLVDGDRVALIDFDLMAAADPIVDIAHFMAFLSKSQERNRRSQGETGSAMHIFLDEYFSLVPESWRSRLSLYHAMTSIHKAVGICRRRGSDHSGLVAEVIREGLGFLVGDGGEEHAPSYRRRLTRSTVR